MTLETVLAITGVWIVAGFLVLRWAAKAACEEDERQVAERARRQGRLAEQLEAARAELRLLQLARGAVPYSRPGSTGCAPSQACLGP